MERGYTYLKNIGSNIFYLRKESFTLDWVRLTTYLRQSILSILLVLNMKCYGSKGFMFNGEILYISSVTRQRVKLT